MDIQISIIIVNFNTSRLLDDCLTSLKQDPALPLSEIIVIDNNSSDSSVDMLTRDHPDVTVIRNRHNAGFAAANNQGLKVASGHYVWLLNPDTIVFPGCARTLMTFLETHPDAGAVSPRTWLDRDRTLEVCSLKLLTPDRARAAFTRLPDPNRQSILMDIWNLDSTLWTAKKPIPVEGIGGAAFFVKKSVLDSINGLDERFFMGYEDTDLCAAIHARHQHIHIHPDAEIVHLFGQAKQTAEAPRAVAYSWREAPMEYLKKYYGLQAATRFKRQRALDSIWRRITPRFQPGLETLPGPDGVTLQWPGPA
nr:glycosyltransferase family 2 protein [bacterium]